MRADIILLSTHITFATNNNMPLQIINAQQLQILFFRLEH